MIPQAYSVKQMPDTWETSTKIQIVAQDYLDDSNSFVIPYAH